MAATATVTATSTAAASLAAAAAMPGICEPGGRGLLLPFIAKENEWDKTGRAFGYLMALLWCFLGVSIVADIFMGAIEAVTSKRIEKQLSNGRTVAIKWWNGTVANLTLMALGSSAPEILLSIIELLGADFYAGELGPGTIVGSAAFNLLVIIAVCVLVIPEGERRTIANFTVFLVTAAFSVFAYLWLIIILAINSPDMVEVWEGVMSFVWFPVLVVLAYLADIGKLGLSQKSQEEKKLDKLRATLVSKEETAEQGFNDKDLSIIQRATSDTHNRTWATHRLKVTKGTSHGPVRNEVPRSEVTVGFPAHSYVFADGSKTVVVEVEKTGRSALRASVVVKYVVIDRLGKPVADPTPLVIEAGETRGKIETQVPAALEAEVIASSSKKSNKAHDVEAGRSDAVDKHFWVELISATYQYRKEDTDDQDTTDVTLRAKNGARVVIPQDRHRTLCKMKPSDTIMGTGHVRFEEPEVDVEPDVQDERVCQLKVTRVGGTNGELRCRYFTQADTARAGRDYVHAKGDLLFEDGAIKKYIDITITPKGQYEGADKFLVFLENIDDDNEVIVEEECNCCVTIKESGSGTAAAAAVMRRLDKAVNFDSIAEGNHKWVEQFWNALRPVAGDADDAAEASVADWAIHFVAVPWKLFFAFIPPCSYCGGKLAFALALVFIGVVTALIGDLAALMGCCMGLPDAITAITIVALGTSLPDTFASKVAAVEERTADAALGNVTGSNSVNVFLGLGLPWMIASIYWNIKGATSEWTARYPHQATLYPEGGFVVEAGDLTFSVVVFTTASVIALGVIGYRRRAFHAELGGPLGVKISTAVLFVLLWLYYVGLASWKILTPSANMGIQVIAIIAGLGAVLVSMVLISIGISLYSHHHEGQTKRNKDLVRGVLMEAKQAEEGHPHNLYRRYTTRLTANLASVDDGADGDIVSSIADLRSHIAGLTRVCDALEREAKERRQLRRKSRSSRSSRRAKTSTELKDVGEELGSPKVKERRVTLLEPEVESGEAPREPPKGKE